MQRTLKRVVALIALGLALVFGSASAGYVAQQPDSIFACCPGGGHGGGGG